MLYTLRKQTKPQIKLFGVGFATFFLCLFIAIGWAKAGNSPTFFDDNFHDYQENLSEARDEKKAAIFIFFYLDDCPFCHKMRQTVLNQAAVIAFYKKHFLNYELDANGSIEIVDFNGNKTTERVFAAKQHRVFATPVLAFFDIKGKMLAYRTGFLNKKDFLLFGRFVEEKQYLKTNFIRYKRKLTQRWMPDTQRS